MWLSDLGKDRTTQGIDTLCFVSKEPSYDPSRGPRTYVPHGLLYPI